MCEKGAAVRLQDHADLFYGFILGVMVTLIALRVFGGV